MTVTESVQALGEWSVRLRPDTPQDVMAKLNLVFPGGFGHIVILPGRVDPSYYGDGLLAAAHYVGVYRRIDKADDGFTASGVGMAMWLGDDDDKGPVLETAVSLTAKTFVQSLTALLPPGGAVTAGTLHAVAGSFSGAFQWQTSRDAFNYVCAFFGSSAAPVEWRVNGDGTVDAGLVSDLYVTTPTAIVTRLPDSEASITLVSLHGTGDLITDVEDYASRVVILAEDTPSGPALGSANDASNRYVDIHGNFVAITRMVSESGTTSGNAAARATAELNAFLTPRGTVQLSSDAYDVEGRFQVGDYVYVYDPDAGFYDLTQEAYAAGVPVHPQLLRVVEATWPVEAGMTVLFRDQSPGWTDLTPYVIFEPSGTDLTVGQLGASLTNLGAQPIDARNLNDSNLRTGVITFTTNAGTQTSQLIVYDTDLPSGLTYGAVACSNGSTLSTGVFEVSCSSVGNHQFTLNVTRSTAVSTTFYWIAFAK